MPPKGFRKLLSLRLFLRPNGEPLSWERYIFPTAGWGLIILYIILHYYVDINVTGPTAIWVTRLMLVSVGYPLLCISLLLGGLLYQLHRQFYYLIRNIYARILPANNYTRDLLIQLGAQKEATDKRYVEQKRSEFLRSLPKSRGITSDIEQKSSYIHGIFGFSHTMLFLFFVVGLHSSIELLSSKSLPLWKIDLAFAALAFFGSIFGYLGAMKLDKEADLWELSKLTKNAEAFKSFLKGSLASH
jgi:hypothetical protein